MDGAIRKVPLIFEEKENLYPHIALKIPSDYLGLEIKEIKPDYILLANQKQNLRIPLVEKNIFLINWLGKWQNTFKHYSFLQVLSGYQDFLENKKPKINLADFKDSICLVAVTAIGLYDIKPIPLQAEYPGVGVIATTISNILDKNFLFFPSKGIILLALYLMCILPSFLVFGEKPLRESIFVFLAAGNYFLLHFLLLRRGMVLELSLPLLGLFTSYLTIETYNFVHVAIEKQKFFKMSITDGLTGLNNIRYFKMLLETEIMLAKLDPNKRFSIAMSDVDHFKHFNDTYGHQVGDLVLKEVSGVLRNSVRSSDIVARYGGEEMIVLLRGSPIRDALNVAEKIRKNIENRLVKDQHNTYKVTVSLGVSTFRPIDDVDSIVKRADEGLYKAKQNGRNRVETEETVDQLTGLYDLKNFKAILDAEVALAKKEVKKELCLIICAISNLKYLTDTYGATTGEWILKDVAHTIETSVRSSDTVARYTEDKIIILLRGTSLKNGLMLCEKIKKNVEKAVIKDDTNIYKVALSLGISDFKPEDAPDTFLKRAEEDLYSVENA